MFFAGLLWRQNIPCLKSDKSASQNNPQLPELLTDWSFLREWRHELACVLAHLKEEIEVCCPGKHFKQEDRQKCNNIVFGSRDAIAHKLHWLLASFYWSISIEPHKSGFFLRCLFVVTLRMTMLFRNVSCCEICWYLHDNVWSSTAVAQQNST